MVTPRPIPDELWQPLQRRHLLFCQLMHLAGWGLVLTAFGVLIAWSIEFAVRVVLPVFIFSGATSVVGWVGAGRTLRRCRQLIIEYHGVDPGPPP